MNEIENEFFEKYKRTDQICKDMYQSGKGISEYIERMKKVPYSLKIRISAWDNYYKCLERLRRIRNILSHQNEPSECTEDDINRIDNFYDDLMNQNDPLAVMRKIQREQETTQKCTSSLAAQSLVRYDKRNDWQKDERVNPENNNLPVILFSFCLIFMFLVALFAIFYSAL